MCAHICLETTIDYCGIAHTGDNSKSGLPINTVFHFRYIISLFIQQPCQIIASRIEIKITSLVKRIFYLFGAEAVTSVSALMTGWAIPQDNRIAHKNVELSKQVKYCFNLPNNASVSCFNKLTGEHNAKKKLKKFLFCGSIFLRKAFKGGVIELQLLGFNSF